MIIGSDCPAADRSLPLAGRPRGPSKCDEVQVLKYPDGPDGSYSYLCSDSSSARDPASGAGVSDPAISANRA